MRWIAMNAEVLLEAGGRVRRVITAHQDITEIFGACEALARADARFHSIFDSQSQYIGVLTPAGSVVEVNRTALDAVGVVLEAVIGQPFWETAWWPEADRERVRRDIVQAAQGSLVRREAETLSADGRRLWIDLSLKPVRDPDTATVMWIVAEGRDITEQRELANKLAQAQKVEALGQLAGGIAHDFNNILQAVSGAATLIDRRPEDIEKVRRVARMTKDAVARGASITQCLLAFARRGELRVEVLATANLMSNLCEVLTSTLGTLITVRNTVPQDIPSVVADRGQLETVLVNLGTNARDAMPNGGTLTFSASTEYVAPGEQHPAGLKLGAYVRLSVADTGTGMDAATLALATEAFFTTKPPGQGTGLGLPMAKAFAEQGGGAMTMTSIPGVGTTIVLWLCQAANGNTGMAINTPEGRSAGKASARILLVDDDHMVRMTLAEQFEDLGFTTLIASSGAEAIALIEAGEPVNALVTDLSMPTMNGVTVIEKARGLHADLPCFLLTGYAGDPAALSAAADFTLIRKPASAKTLAAYVEAGLESGMPSRGRSDGLTPARMACG
jgi:PAS domain S-box-containing protein